MTEICHACHREYEEWLYLDAGRLVCVIENDGRQYLKRGAERQTCILTAQQALDHFWNHRDKIYRALGILCPPVA